MKVIECRKFIRHPLCMPLAYKMLSPGEKAEPAMPAGERSRTRNVSLGGLLFSSKNMLKKGARIVLNMPFEDKMFNVRARVVRCMLNAETRLYDIAVSFMRVQEAFKVKMIEQIYLIAEFRDLLSLQSGKQVSLEEASKVWIRRYSARFKKLYW
ncbi:MAG: PilZ domain-containing protein [Candidatus Omnitrophota bacterium]